MWTLVIAVWTMISVSCLLAGVHDWYRAQFMRKNVASFWWGVWYELPLDIWLHWKWHYICFITLHVLGEFRSENTLVFPNWFWSPWSSIVSNCHGFYGMLLSVVLTMYSSLLYRLQIHTLNNEFENLTFILCFLHVKQSLNESHFFSLLTIFNLPWRWHFNISSRFLAVFWNSALSLAIECRHPSCSSTPHLEVSTIW